MGDLGIDSRDLVERVWHEVALRETLAAEPFEHKEPFRSVELNHDAERHYINAHCILASTPSEVASFGPLAQGKARLKRRAGHFIVAVLERYFADEREFLAHLVRFQNNVADAHDELGREIAALEHLVRVESLALKQRIAILNETLEELRATSGEESRTAAP